VVLNKFNEYISKLNKEDKNTKNRPSNYDETIFKNILKDILEANSINDDKTA
jgi:hypothetical protein